MQPENEYVLEQSRDDKIKTLGFLCYNLYIDGVMVFPEMNEIVDNIKKTLNYFLVLKQNNADLNYLHMQENTINEKLTELGCICYNLYVDSKLFNNKVLSLCDSIFSINHEISNGLSVPVYREYQDSNEKHYDFKSETSSMPKKKSDAVCPYGMEPIPVNFKRCSCGYRNRTEARFCGKCGAKLP